ncbi:MAG: hypothetical protein ACQGQP_00300 [Desulfovibrio sp.]|jgi:predicted Zn-dependent protease|nr:tetratricopeptide repeat protein [Mailhella sp.]
MAALSKEQRQSLHVLAFMLFRMGQEERAQRIYDGLRALSVPGHPDRMALAGLAAIAIDRGDGAAALKFLDRVLDDKALPARRPAFVFMKAQALWLEGRKAEARAVLDDYLAVAKAEGNDE